MQLNFSFPVLAMVCVLSSCSALQVGGLREVTRAPASPAIELTRDITIKSFGGPITYAAGFYTPKYQDSSGTFYMSTVKSYVFDSVMKRKNEMDEAGLYLRDDRKGGLHVWNGGAELIYKRPVSELKVTEQPSFVLVGSPGT